MIMFHRSRRTIIVDDFERNDEICDAEEVEEQVRSKLQPFFDQLHARVTACALLGTDGLRSIDSVVASGGFDGINTLSRLGFDDLEVLVNGDEVVEIAAYLERQHGHPRLCATVAAVHHAAAVKTRLGS